MTPTILASLAAFAFAVGGAAPAEDAKAAAIQADYDALTGTWQLVKSVVDGVPVPEAEVRKLS